MPFEITANIDEERITVDELSSHDRRDGDIHVHRMDKCCVTVRSYFVLGRILYYLLVVVCFGSAAEAGALHENEHLGSDVVALGR